MFVSAVERDREFEPDAGLAFDEHPGLGARLRPWATAWQARRPACPFCTRFEPQGAVDPRGVAQPRHADPPVGALSAVNRKGSVSHRPLNWPVFTLTGRVSFALATFAFAPHRMGLEPRKSKHHKHLTPFPKQRVVMTGGAYGEPDKSPRKTRSKRLTQNPEPRGSGVSAFLANNRGPFRVCPSCGRALSYEMVRLGCE